MNITRNHKGITTDMFNQLRKISNKLNKSLNKINK